MDVIRTKMWIKMGKEQENGIKIIKKCQKINEN